MRLPCVIVLSLLTLIPLSALAQLPADFTRIYGTSDTNLPTPAHIAKTGQDASAIQYLLNFIKTTGLTGWTGMVGNGTISIIGDPTPHPAQLSIAGGSSYRLDVQYSDGMDSTIVSGLRGVFIPRGGQSVTLGSDLDYGGLLTLPRFLYTGYPLASTTVLDRGQVSLNGTSFGRVTFDDASSQPDACSYNKTVDLYFASSSLLDSTSTNARLSSQDLACYVIVTSYSNYQKVATSSFPFTIAQTMNGNPQWTLTLTTVTLAPPTDTSIFLF